VSLPEIVVALLRAAHVAAVLSAFGTLVFLAFVAPDAARGATGLTRALLRLVLISVACALLAGLAWLVADSALIAGADDLATTLSAVPVVAAQTQYGRWFLLRCGLLVLVPFATRLGRPGLAAAVLLSGGSLAIQPMMAHAGAIGGALGTELIASEVLHLLAAGAWLGGLLPLFIATGMLPDAEAAGTCRNFSPVGLSAVVVLAGTAMVQIGALAGGLPGLFGTAYGRIALVKLVLFLVLLGLAGLNRFMLTERLAEGRRVTRLQVRLSVATEALLGLSVVTAAAFLASGMPGAHEQPTWPFAWRPSLAAWSDPALRRDLIVAAVGTACGLAIAVAGLSLAWRRRWLIIGTGLVILALALPRFDVLFVPAYPTSYFTSPTEFAATAIVHGARLFAAHCTSCHGVEARGDGPAVPSLPMQPADLTAEHFWAHDDGDLYWYVAHGFTTDDGRTAMNGFAGTVSPDGIWDLLDYLRAQNAGDSMRRLGRWLHPLPVPQFDAACADGRTIDLDDLRGRPLRIAALSEESPPEALPVAGLAMQTIVISRSRGARPANGDCIASEPETWTAFAILLGVPEDRLAGAQILSDQNGWLRIAWRPGDPRPDAATLAATLRDITAHPVVAPPAGGHLHPH